MDKPETMDTATTVDMLIERMKTHPQEFFNEASLGSGDANAIFSATKWRRITVALLEESPTVGNMIQAWFKPTEIVRFREGLMGVMRDAFDAQLVEALVSGRPTFDKPAELNVTSGSLYTRAFPYQAAAGSFQLSGNQAMAQNVGMNQANAQGLAPAYQLQQQQREFEELKRELDEKVKKPSIFGKIWNELY